MEADRSLPAQQSLSRQINQFLATMTLRLEPGWTSRLIAIDPCIRLNTFKPIAPDHGAYFPLTSLSRILRANPLDSPKCIHTRKPAEFVRCKNQNRYLLGVFTKNTYSTILIFKPELAYSNILNAPANDIDNRFRRQVIETFATA